MNSRRLWRGVVAHFGTRKHGPAHSLEFIRLRRSKRSTSATTTAPATTFGATSSNATAPIAIRIAFRIATGSRSKNHRHRPSQSPLQSASSSHQLRRRNGLHQVLRCMLVELEARDGLLFPGRGVLQKLLPVDVVPSVRPVRGRGYAGDGVPPPAERPRHGRRPRAVVHRLLGEPRVEHGVVQVVADVRASRRASGLRARALARPAGATRRRAGLRVLRGPMSARATAST